MNYLKRGLFVYLFFFSMVPFSIAQVTIEGLLHIQGEALLHAQDAVVIQTVDGIVENNGTLEIGGDLIKANESTLITNPSGQGSRTVNMVGTTTQRIDGNFTGNQSFYNFQIDKAAGMVELNNDIEINNNLNIVNGKIRTDITSGTQASDYQHEIFVSNAASNALNTANTIGGYIEGNLRRAVTGMNAYSFPVGLNENQSFTVNFTSPANSSEVVAAFESGSVTTAGTTVTCNNSEDVSIDCVIGKWNILGNGVGDTYNISFAPSTSLRSNCPNASSYFVAKNGQVNCPADIDSSNGISSSGFTNFGVFDIPTAASGVASNACGIVNPIAFYLGNKKSIIDWDRVPNAKRYRLQLRFKGMDQWIVTALLRSTYAFIYAPSNRDYEYRIQTICEDGDSEYTSVFEWSTSDNGLVSAESRNADDFKADITIDDEVALNFEAFPNPTNDLLQIAYKANSDKTRLILHHVSGKKVFDQLLVQDQLYHRINLQSLSEGIYLLSIKEKGKQILSQKVIKGSNR